ncbi:MAG TPA: hypothetical protein VFZ44_00250 [Pyrinomonadaceae bacterium]
MILSLLLKKALPFALTFVVGTALGGLTWLFGGSEKKTETVVVTRTYEFGSRCRMRGHKLVAETKPLTILFKPDARWPNGFEPGTWPGGSKVGYKFPGAKVRVTFGADGKVHRVEPSDEPYPSLGTSGDKIVWECMERAARQIQFKPETVDGVPVTVTQEVNIGFMPE